MLHTAAGASSTPFFLYFPIHAAFIAKNSSGVEKSYILYNFAICCRKTLFNKNILSLTEKRIQHYAKIPE